MAINNGRYRLPGIWAAGLLCCLMVVTSTAEPITGPRLDSLIASHDVPLEEWLRKTFPEGRGFFVTGPLDPFIKEEVDVSGEVTRLYRTTRVICPDLQSLQSAEAALRADPDFEVSHVSAYLMKARRKATVGYRGVLVDGTWSGRSATIQFVTTHQIRWLMWAHRVLWSGDKYGDKQGRRKYAEAVSNYLYAIDQGLSDADVPKAAEYGLPIAADLFAPLPGTHVGNRAGGTDPQEPDRAVNTDYARGILRFVPTDSLLDAIKRRAPHEAFSNELCLELQYEYREMSANGDDPNQIRTLTRSLFETLPAGAYMFAVGVTGLVRYVPEDAGFDLACLFPGEPLLGSGTFSVVRNSNPRLSAVNAGHLFNELHDAIIAGKDSDYYLLTLGHFFTALDRLGISYEQVEISKF